MEKKELIKRIKKLQRRNRELNELLDTQTLLNQANDMLIEMYREENEELRVCIDSLTNAYEGAAATISSSMMLVDNILDKLNDEQ